jgi:hypothetical protein
LWDARSPKKRPFRGQLLWTRRAPESADLGRPALLSTPLAICPSQRSQGALKHSYPQRGLIRLSGKEGQKSRSFGLWSAEQSSTLHGEALLRPSCGLRPQPRTYTAKLRSFGLRPHLHSELRSLQGAAGWPRSFTGRLPINKRARRVFNGARRPRRTVRRPCGGPVKIIAPKRDRCKMRRIIMRNKKRPERCMESRKPSP